MRLWPSCSIGLAFTVWVACWGSITWADCLSPAGIAGQKQWSSSNSQIEFCDGNNWISTAVVSAGTSCSTSGQIRYNSSPVDMRFCNGSEWMSMTSTLTNGSCSGTAAGTIQWNLVKSWIEWCDGFNWWPMIAQPNLNLNFMAGALPAEVRFSRAVSGTNSPGTYITSAGSIALAPQNMFMNSQDLTSSWIISGGTVVANATTAPDGTVSAGSFGETATTSTHLFYQNISVGSGVPYALSVYIKNGDGSRVPMLGLGFTGGIVFCHYGLSGSGSVLSNATHNAAVFSAPACSISSVGNGWYRASLATTSGSIQTVQAGLRFKQVNNGVSSYTGDGVSGMYAWGLQIESGTIATSYAYTTSGTAGGPRFDYSPSTVGSLNGLLIEPQRTNLVWPSTLSIGTFGSGGVSVAPSAVVAPDGSLANKLIEDTSNGLHQRTLAVTIGSGQAYSFSAYFKAGERTSVVLNGGKQTSPFPRGVMTINLLTGSFSGSLSGSPLSVINRRVTAYPNGWYRAELTVLADATSTDGAMDLRMRDGANQSVYTGDGTSGLYIWGVQIELGKYASSYIPTSTGAVTRAADVALVPGLSWISTENGTIYAKASSGNFLNDSVNAETQIVASLENSGASGRIQLRRGNGSAADVDGRISSIYFRSTQQAGGLTADGSWPLMSTVAVAQAFSNTRMQSAASGVLAGALVTGGTTFAPNALYIGSSAIFGNSFGGWIQNLRYYPQVMTDGQLRRITTYAP